MRHEVSVGERQEVTLEKQDGLQPEVKESVTVKHMDSGADSLDSKAGSNIYYWVALRKLLSISEYQFPYLSTEDKKPGGLKELFHLRCLGHCCTKYPVSNIIWF